MGLGRSDDRRFSGTLFSTKMVNAFLIGFLEHKEGVTLKEKTSKHGIYVLFPTDGF